MVLNILFLSHYYASFFVKHQGRQIYQSQAEKADWLSAPSNCNIFCVHILFLWPLLNNLWAWPGPTVVSVKTSTYCSTARIFTLAFCSALRRKMVSAGMKSKSPLGTRLPFAAHVWSTWVCRQGFSSRLGGLHNLIKAGKCQVLSYGLDNIAQ